MLLRLLDVLDRDEAAQDPGAVHHQQLLDAVGVQQLLRALEAGPLGHRDELLGHHGADRLLQIALEANVAVGDDADRPTVSRHHGQARDVVSLHQLERLGQLLVGADGYRVDHHPGLGLLDLLNLEGLLGDGEILVNDPDAALPRHTDGGGGLGHRVHGRRYDRHGQLDGSRQRRLDVGVLRDDVALGRDQQDVVEGESLSQRTIGQHHGRLASAPRCFKGAERRGSGEGAARTGSRAQGPRNRGRMWRSYRLSVTHLPAISRAPCSAAWNSAPISAASLKLTCTSCRRSTL